MGCFPFSWSIWVIAENIFFSDRCNSKIPHILLFLPVWSFQSPFPRQARKTGSALECQWSSPCTPRPAAAVVSSGSHSSVACGAGWWRNLSAAEWRAASRSLNWKQLGRRTLRMISHLCLCHDLDPGSCPYHGLCPALKRKISEAKIS